MGASASAVAASRRDAILAFARRQHNQLPKIVILGPMGSGKTTLFRMICKGGKRPAITLAYYRHNVENYLLEIWRHIRNLCQTLNVDTASYEDDFRVIAEFRHREQLSDKARPIGDNFHCLRKKKLLLELPCNYAYFLQSGERIINKKYLPTEMDVQLSYAQSVGLDSTLLRLPYGRFQLLDLPGNRTFRRKWSNFFINCQVLVFVVDLTDLCRPEFYDGHLKNRTMNMLSEVLTNQTLRDAHLILLLNKRDLFEDSAANFSFSKFWSDVRSADQAAIYYKTRLMSVATNTTPTAAAPAIPSSRRVYEHNVSLPRGSSQSAVMESLRAIYQPQSVSEAEEGAVI